MQYSGTLDILSPSGISISISFVANAKSSAANNHYAVIGPATTTNFRIMVGLSEVFWASQQPDDSEDLSLQRSMTKNDKQGLLISYNKKY